MVDGPVVAMAGIGKRFPGIVALEDVSFDLRAGEVHALMGENGAGKSTLMKILSGNLRPDSGSLRVFGEETRFAGPADAIARGIGTIHQELTVIPHLSVAENLFLGRLPVGSLGLVSRRALHRQARKALEPLGFEADLTIAAGDLPLGLQQLVEIAKSLVRDARVMIMDEPTSSLSDVESARLWETVGRLRRDRRAIVFISHKIDEVLRLADRITVLRDGRQVATRPRSEFDADGLVALMVGRAVAHDRPAPHAASGPPVLQLERAGRAGRFSDVSLEVRAGEIVGLAGLVGSGRTDVARAVFGADPLDDGRMLLKGEAYRPASPRQAIAAGVGLVPEDRKQQALILDMSVAENIVLPATERLARLGLVDAAAERRLAEAFADRVALHQGTLDRRVLQLSGGNQQKVVLARWLAMQPSLLVVDEPTRGIDIAAKTEVHALLRQLAGSGTAILLVSSEMAEILALSDRVIVMRGGRIVAELTGEAAGEAIIGRHALGVDAA